MANAKRHLHPHWSCSRSIWCWFHCSRLSHSSLSPPTKLVTLDHLATMIYESSKIHAEIIYVHWVDQLEMNRTCVWAREQETPTFHCTPSKPDVQGDKKSIPGKEKVGWKAIMRLVGTDNFCWVIGFTLNFLQTIHRLRTEQTAFLIWGIPNFFLAYFCNDMFKSKVTDLFMGVANRCCSKASDPLEGELICGVDGGWRG